MSTSGLRIASLEAAAGTFRLGPLELDLPPGGYGCIVGPSGSGKSTLLRALAGLVPAQGQVEIGGAPSQGPPERRGIAWVPQGGLLFPHLDAAGNVAFAARDAAAASAALVAVGAQHLAGRDVRSLSGGEVMRVALARALVRRPQLLLLDEPLSSIDPAGRAPLRDLLAAIPARTGAPVLHVTHDFDEACALGSHLGVLIAGRLQTWGAPGEVLARPPSAEVADFLGLENVLAGSFEPGDEVSIFRRGALALQVAGRYGGEGVVTFAGTAVSLAPASPAGSARNSLPATVRALEPRALGVLVHLDVQGTSLVARVTAPSVAELALRPGAPVVAVVKATAIHAISRTVR